MSTSGRWTNSHFEELMSLRPGERPLEDRCRPQVLWPGRRWRDVSDEFSCLAALSAWECSPLPDVCELESIGRVVA